MSDPYPRVRIDEVDWRQVFAWTQLFRAFRMAIQPGKLALATALVLWVLLVTAVLDRAFPPVAAGEFEAYLWHARLAEFEGREPAGFEDWIAREQGAGFDAWLAKARQDPGGEPVSRAMLQHKARFLAVQLGLNDGAEPRLSDTLSIAGFIRYFTAWAWTARPGYVISYLLAISLVAVWLVGAIARMASLQATGRGPVSPLEGLAFARRHYPWLLATPLMTPLFAVLFLAPVTLANLIAFNVPFLDSVGGLFFGLAVLLSLVAGMILLVGLLSLPMALPAVTVEGADAFDAVSRIYGYVICKPWHYALYVVIGGVYAKICLAFVALVAVLGMIVSRWTIGLASFRHDPNLLMPWPTLADPLPALDANALGVSLGAAILLRLWMILLACVVLGTAVSLKTCLSVQLYLLMRRANDGTDFDEVFNDDQPLDLAPDQATPTGEADATATGAAAPASTTGS